MAVTQQVPRVSEQAPGMVLQNIAANRPHYSCLAALGPDAVAPPPSLATHQPQRN